MPALYLCFLALAHATESAPVQPVIDGSSATRWLPCTSWVTQPPAKYSVINEQGHLLFSAEGPQTELPWLLNLEGFGFTGDERYLLIRYQATGLAATRGNYFVHGQEGTVGGRTYASADQIQADDRWHTLAIDLVALEPPETTHGLALKMIVGAGGKANLRVERIWFSDALPAEAQLATQPPRRVDQAVTVDWQTAGNATAQPGWTPTPAAAYGLTREGSTATFRVDDAGRGMRWLLKLPQPADLAATPYLAVRYRASGQCAHTTYALWLGQGSGGTATIPLSAGDLRTDGAWHNLCLKVDKVFTATQLAVGLDCAADQAVLTLDTIRFSARPRSWTLAEALPHERRDRPWPTGQDGFVATNVPVRGGRPSSFFLQRVELGDWFATSHVTVDGIPFEVPTDLAQIPQSGVNNFGTLALDLPPDAREVYLLVANSAPATEPWGIDWAHPKPQELLDVPEKVDYEIRYASGPPDRVLPLDVGTRQWGLKRGLSVSVVHPDPSRRATELILHDRMQTASFALLAATTRRGEPRLRAPDWESLAYGTPPADPLRAARPGVASPAADTVNANVLQASFDTSAGLRWSQLSISGLADQLACAGEPVFHVIRAGSRLAATDWRVERVEADGPGRRFFLRHRQALLAAEIECVPGRGSELLLRMGLTNVGPESTTVTLQFPILRGLRLGSAAATWYLVGKRGGIINSTPAMFREPLGERHPLQVDGFFNPQSGLALACLTHDTHAQHHFVQVGKSAEGGEWYPEYVQRDLRPGETWQATEAALVLCAGDWRAIFAAYTDWLGTWFRPVAPRKPWFERAFAMASDNAHYDAIADPKQRGSIERVANTMLEHLGHCDYLHLFGWSASRTYGDWGDYDHYDETVGGQDYFRKNIRRAQDAGIAVSLYLDGYLSSAKGKFAGAHAQDWAMRRADGTPQYVEIYDAYNQCPYIKGWQEHLSQTYGRVLRDLAPRILYIDEYGATDGRWACQAKDHGHPGYEIPYAGEVAMLKQIRATVGPEVVLYTEYPPAEVSRQYLDGSITYQALWSADQESLAPHFIDLPRFAFPDFKQLHIIHYVATRAGNWWLLKYPFFNGEVYRIGVPNLAGMDAPSHAFLKRAVSVQCAHRDAFASHAVYPLVATEVSGVFANLFETAQERVWTLYNANGRSVHKPVLRVRHAAVATYEDAWNAVPLTPVIRDGQADLEVPLGPKSVGCVVQKIPGAAR